MAKSFYHFRPDFARWLQGFPDCRFLTPPISPPRGGENKTSETDSLVFVGILRKKNPAAQTDRGFDPI
jgi:hypothetical protein